MGSDQRTFVKICGITRLGDARAAIKAGANALGFVFAPSPRHVSAADARDIARHVHPAVQRFGVFVDASVDKLLATVSEADLDSVQLQGQESNDYIEELRSLRPSLFIAKVVRTNKEEDLVSVGSFPAADAIFLDPKDVRRPASPSAEIPSAWLQGLSSGRLVVAGGLDHTNVGALVKQVRPWGVDVSSGVENAPGKKDPALMRSFVAAVREAESAIRVGSGASA